MKARGYLPSGQFSLLIASVVASGGLIYAAGAYTKPPTSFSPQVSVAPEDAAAAAAHADWQQSLATIQAQSGVTLPQAPDQSTVSAVLAAAKTSNVTDTVARSLLVNLTAAKAQGLGDDIPTQNQIISQAVEQIKQEQRAGAYTQNDLTVVADSKASQHDYGNAIAAIFAAHQENDYGATMVVLDNATSQNDASQLKQLNAVANNYAAITATLLKTPVPRTLVPFHLELVNNFKAITDSYTDMEGLMADPVRGMAAIQTYESLTQATLRMFINIAQALNKDGILFTKDEPGAVWGIVLSGQ